MEAEFYKEYIKNELAHRCERNPRYSTRAFAKALGFNHGALSQIISGKRIPSYRTAKRLIEALGLSPDQEQSFLQSLAMKHATRNLQRVSRKLKVSSSSIPNFKAKELSIDLFRVIADWYHTAIMALSLTSGFQSDIRWIASQLSISITAARLAVERLLELGLLKESNGKWSMTNEPFTTADKHLTTPALKKLQKL